MSTTIKGDVSNVQDEREMFIKRVLDMNINEASLKVKLIEAITTGFVIFDGEVISRTVDNDGNLIPDVYNTTNHGVSCTFKIVDGYSRHYIDGDISTRLQNGWLRIKYIGGVARKTNHVTKVDGISINKFTEYDENGVELPPPTPAPTGKNTFNQPDVKSETQSETVTGEDDSPMPPLLTSQEMIDTRDLEIKKLRELDQERCSEINRLSTNVEMLREKLIKSGNEKSEISTAFEKLAAEFEESAALNKKLAAEKDELIRQIEELKVAGVPVKNDPTFEGLPTAQELTNKAVEQYKTYLATCMKETAPKRTIMLQGIIGWEKHRQFTFDYFTKSGFTSNLSNITVERMGNYTTFSW
jgi:hypothetical protein